MADVFMRICLCLGQYSEPGSGLVFDLGLEDKSEQFGGFNSVLNAAQKIEDLLVIFPSACPRACNCVLSVLLILSVSVYGICSYISGPNFEWIFNTVSCPKPPQTVSQYLPFSHTTINTLIIL